MLRLSMLFCLWMVSSPLAAEESLRDYFLSEIPHDDDALLSWRRDSCAEGAAEGIYVELAAQNGRDRGAYPNAGEHCLVVLRETTRRGALLAPYAAQGDAARVLRAVLTAAGQGAAEYQRLDGAVQTLHCGTAFDAGFVFASLRTDAGLPDLSGRDLDALTKACFENATGSFDGLVAGMHSARERR